MSMSFQRLEPSIPENPALSAAYQRIVDFLEGQRRSGEGTPREFSTKRLVDVAGAVPSVGLAQVLSRLVEKGVLGQFIRVETDRGEGLEDFESLEQIPDEVYDWRESHENVRITPNNLRVYYRLLGTV